MRRWYAFSGIVDRKLSESTEVTSTVYEVFHKTDGTVVHTAGTQSAGIAYIVNNGLSLTTYGLRQVRQERVVPAISKGVFLIPLTPLPLFTSPGKVLTTRGFWDVTSITSPAGNVSNFAFGMVFVPPASVLLRGVAESDDVDVETYDWREDASVPDPLLDDPGFFAYDSFVRVTTDVNQDPPFHSKTNKRFPANSVLCATGAVEVAVEALQSLSIRLGIRFRVLIET